MKVQTIVVLFCLALDAQAQPGIASFSRSGSLVLSNAYENGVCTIEHAGAVMGPWRAARNVFTTSEVAQANVPLTGPQGFYRALARDLANGRIGFTNLTRAY